MTDAGATPTREIQQASAVPFRMSGGRVELCLITSIGGRQWGFPKGIVDPGETPAETALKEAREEAGLTGRLVGDPLGSYRYRKWEADLTVLVWLMEVVESLPVWDEQNSRLRAWIEPDEARKLVRREYLQPILELALDRLRGEM